MKKEKSAAVEIGVKNKRIFTDLAGIITSIIGMAVILTWLLWNGNLYGEYMLINGREVSAVITDYEYFTESVDMDTSHPSTVTGWHNIYRYFDESGREYSGYCYWWKTAQDAEGMLGKTVPVVIDPNGYRSELGTMKQFNVHYDHERDLALAISFSVLFAASAFVLVYRGIYRDRLNKKIAEAAGGSANGFLSESYVVQGEVVCVFGLIWYYLKVAYTDKLGIRRRKWARAWFTRREARFLKRKRFINIVPYKNTYGVLERITVEK